MCIYRFRFIYTNLCGYSLSEAKVLGTVNKNNKESFDSLSRLRPIWNVAMACFQKARNPPEVMTFDEAMELSTGRFSPSIHMPNKPIKNGVRIDCLNDKSSYLYNALIFCREPLQYEEVVGKTGATMLALATSAGIPELWRVSVPQNVSPGLS